jgi:hypothetical protein
MNKTLVIISTILVAVGGIGLGVYLVGQRQSLTGKAAPATSLSISPTTLTKAPGASFTFNVLANTGTNQVTGVDLIINYNPSNVQVDTISKGSAISIFDTEIRKNIDATTGQIAYSAFTLDKTKAVTGNGLTVLTVNGKVKPGATAGTYNFSFGSGTGIAGLTEGQNLLTGSTPGVLTVTGSPAGPTASPTIAPLVGQSPTPKASATPTGSGLKTQTPTTIPIPVTGTSWPTIGGAVLGGAVIVFSLLLAF